MKYKTLVSILSVLILAACSPAAPTAAPASLPSPTVPASLPSATPPASQQQATKITATAPISYPAPTENVPLTSYPAPQATTYPAPQATSYPAPQSTVQTTFNPLPATTRYGIAKVDAILDALMSGKSDSISPFIVYLSAPCTKKTGIGGPPQCQADETEGTSVIVLPTMGPEGSFIRKNSENLINLPGNVEILGAFSVKADFKSEQYYPAGKYSILIRIKNTLNMLGLRVSDAGIVRVDYLHQLPDNNQPDFDKMLAPK